MVVRGKNWFVFQDGKETGPFTLSEIEKMAKEGEIDKNPKVRPDASAKWRDFESAKVENGYGVDEQQAMKKINAYEMDDRTTAIDVKTLRRAEMEAAKALKQAEQSEKAFEKELAKAAPESKKPKKKDQGFFLILGVIFFILGALVLYFKKSGQ